MPTFGETALVTLTGFDRHKGLYKSVTATSPLKDKVALVHGALRAYALAHSFDNFKIESKQGFAGHVNLSDLIRELFEVAPSNEEELIRSISQGGKKAGLIQCVSAGNHSVGQLPIWWVASDFEKVTGHPPLMSPAAQSTTALTGVVAPKKAENAVAPPQPDSRPKKGGSAFGTGRVKDSRNTQTKETMAVIAGILSREARPMLVAELMELGNFPLGVASVRHAIKLLEKDRKIFTRGINEEDREALKATNGPKNLPKTTKIVAHRSIVPTNSSNRKLAEAVPTVTWRQPAPAPAPAPAPRTEAPLEESFDEIDALINKLEKAPAKKPEVDLDRIAALEQQVADLEARLTKVTIQRDRLLAVVETMKDE